MRTHRTHQTIAPWSIGTPVTDPARLAVVRIEPVLRQRRPAFVLDFCVADARGMTIVPLVLADPATVAERDRDPLVFPAGMPGGDDFAAGLAERILPHLERLVLGGRQVFEHAVMFEDSPSFEAARDAGCFGAAPLRDALARLGPYFYARRFSHGRAVYLDAPDAVGGWALLRTSGTVMVAAARRDVAALAWYGPAPSAAGAPGAAEVAVVAGDADPGAAACVLRLDAGGARLAQTAGHVVEVIDPVPLDVGITFDPPEGPACRWFVVERAAEPRLRSVPPPHPTPIQGSSGRIVVLMGRADAGPRPSSDSDEARALIDALAAEGFDALLAESPDELAGADLVHVIGTRDGRRARAAVEAARRAGIPCAVHAYEEDAADGGWWGAEVARYCFEYGDDERDVQTYLAMLAQRAVAVGAARADGPYAPPEAGVDDAAAALRDASIVFAATEEEAGAVRARSGRRGPVTVVPPLAPAAMPQPIGALTGPDPFVLVHAPIGPLANQLLVARCASDAGIPLVLAGPVADASYLERVREFGGPRLVVLADEPAPGVAAALRFAAAVVVDAAWIGEGGARLAAAALAGARIAVADRRRFTVPGVAPRRFDPADATALRRALGEAWDEALRSPARAAPETAAALAPDSVVRAIARGYASIASPSVP